jgi:uncharacterized phiE125 gp8 family phage protein
MSVTLTQVKKALKIDYNTDDSEILRLIDAVTAWVENYTGVTVTPKKKVMYLSYWTRTMFLDFPFSSIDSVKYTASDGTLTTMPSTDYFIDKTNPPRYFINFSEYPSIKEHTFIEINYTVGYPDVPKDIEQAIIAFVGAWYNNPEALSPISMQTVPISAQFILDNIKVRSLLE